jgi:excisionase family DNA binding protein
MAPVNRYGRCTNMPEQVNAEKARPINRAALSMDEFCKQIGISRSTFYALSPADRPRSVRAGRPRVVIPAESVAEWMRAREVK